MRRTGLAAAVLAAPLLSAPCLAPDLAPAGGFGPHALRLTTTTDALPGTAALGYAAAPGKPVLRRYTLTDNSEADLLHVTVHDPDAGAAVHCGRYRIAPWSSLTCTAVFPAAAGAHTTAVRATASVEGMGIRLGAEATAGYRAGAAVLTLRETLLPTAARALPAGPSGGAIRPGAVLHPRYALSVGGDLPLRDIVVSDSLGVTGLDCGSHRRAVVELQPGTTADCTAVLRAAKGRHSGRADAVGVQAVPGITPAGPAPALSVRAGTASAYTAVPAAPPSPSATPPPGTTSTSPRPSSTSPASPRPGTATATAPASAPATATPGTRPRGVSPFVVSGGSGGSGAGGAGSGAGGAGGGTGGAGGAGGGTGNGYVPGPVSPSSAGSGTAQQPVVHGALTRRQHLLHRARLPLLLLLLIVIFAPILAKRVLRAR